MLGIMASSEKIAKLVKCGQESVSFQSLGVRLNGALFLPHDVDRAPAIVVCHGCGEFKENYFEFCEFLAGRGIASLAVDMHGHGESGGERFHVNMTEWVADVRAALDYLSNHAGIDPSQMGALGLSSGGTAILETALVDERLSFLVAMDATVRNTMPLPLTWCLHGLNLVAKLKKRMTGRDLRLRMIKLFQFIHVVTDFERKMRANPKSTAAFESFPFPGAAQAFFVDTIKRAPKIKAPTLVLWGEEDQLDPPKTARMLYKALTCKKAICIVPGNGHLGHLDKNRGKVFALTAEWILENTSSSEASLASAAA